MPQAAKKSEDLREQYPNAWIAQNEGDTLEGTVTAVKRAWSDQKNNGMGDGWYPLLMVRTSDGVELGFHAFTTVTYREVIDQRPRPGEKIIVTYQGEGRAKAGMNAPRIFSVRLPDRDPKEAADNVYNQLAPSRGNEGTAVVSDPVGTQEEIPF